MRLGRIGREIGAELGLIWLLGAFPDCQASCGGVTLRSAARSKTSEPEWAQDFTFGVKKPLGDEIVFKVFANNPRGQDALLGLVTLKIAELEADTSVRGLRVIVVEESELLTLSVLTRTSIR